VEKITRKDADILVYGCNVAEGIQGEDFVRKFSELIQADVAASTNLTGSQKMPEDWELEFTTGPIETSLPFSSSVRSIYADVLKQIRVVNTSDEGEGSLRWAITQANENLDDDLIDLSGVSAEVLNPAIKLHICSNKRVWQQVIAPVDDGTATTQF